MKKTSTVQLVRNATLKIRYAGHTMLIDPVLADKGTLISALGVNKTPRVHLTIPIQDIIGTSTAFSNAGGDFNTYLSAYIEYEVGVDNQLYYVEARSAT